MKEKRYKVFNGYKFINVYVRYNHILEKDLKRFTDEITDYEVIKIHKPITR